MPRKISLILCLAVAALGVACSDSPAPAPDTREADIQAVKQVEASWAKDAASKDPDKWASYFTDDASGLYPGAPIINGKGALRAALAAYFADPVIKERHPTVFVSEEVYPADETDMYDCKFKFQVLFEDMDPIQYFPILTDSPHKFCVDFIRT